MKILVTGGAGFIGSHLVNYFESNGNEVLVIDNYTTGAYKEFTINTKVIYASLSVSKYFENEVLDFKPEVIIHAAATYAEPDNWILDIESNIIGTVNLIRVAQKVKQCKFIFLQTSLSYGLSKSDTLFKHNSPYFLGGYSGGSSYAITKTAAELFLSISGINFISLRLGNIFGPRNYSGPIPIFYKNLKNKCKSILVDSYREFLYINDLIECIDLAIKSDIKQGYFNVSSGISISIVELFYKIADCLDIQVTNDLFDKKVVSNDDTLTLSLDCSQTLKDLNWKSKTQFNIGLKETIKSYELDVVSNTFTHLKLFDKND